MEHWRQAYLGMRSIPHTLNEFELATFFTFSSKERALINARRRHLYRFALALHIGFVRMSGRTLDACRYVPRNLWQHLGQQLCIESPDLGTMTALYDGHTDTLFEHQVCAYQALGFGPMTEHQRRYVMRWLKSALSGRQDRNGLLHELKRWLYEHRILLPRDRTLRELIVQAIRDVEAELTGELLQALGETTLDRWPIAPETAWRGIEPAAVAVVSTPAQFDTTDERALSQGRSSGQTRRADEVARDMQRSHRAALCAPLR